MKTATATITVSIGGVPKTFTAAGETDGDIHSLAGRLAYQVAGDAQDWTSDEGTKAEIQARRAARADDLAEIHPFIDITTAVQPR